MKRLTRAEATATIPFPEPWQRKAIASLYAHAGLRIPLHLLPPTQEQYHGN